MTKHFYVDGLQYPLPNREYFVEAQTAGLDLLHITVVYWQDCLEAITVLGDWLTFLRANADLLYPAVDAEGLHLDTEDKRIGIIFGFQNCSPIANNLRMLEVYRRLNVGIMQLSYNNQSALCCGCYESYDSGLSRFGREAIKEMNRLGLIVDMSHSSEKSTLEAIEASQRPVTISHAQSQHFHRALRNKSETVIKELLASGGMLGLSLYPFHIKDGGDCTLETLTTEIRRLVDAYGIDGIGFGTDLCQGQPVSELEHMRNGRWTNSKDYGEGSPENSGWPAPPSWYSRVGDFPKLQQGLEQAGFSATEVAKIMGGNWLNFLRASLAAHSPGGKSDD